MINSAVLPVDAALTIVERNTGKQEENENRRN
jgi:hypothetical protein